MIVFEEKDLDATLPAHNYKMVITAIGFIL